MLERNGGSPYPFSHMYFFSFLSGQHFIIPQVPTTFGSRCKKDPFSIAWLSWVFVYCFLFFWGEPHFSFNYKHIKYATLKACSIVMCLSWKYDFPLGNHIHRKLPTVHHRICWFSNRLLNPLHKKTKCFSKAFSCHKEQKNRIKAAWFHCINTGWNFKILNFFVFFV